MSEKERIKLKSLKLSGFKSFSSAKNPKEITFGDINVIIGANGSGKSNLVSFFEMFDRMIRGYLQEYIGLEGSVDTFLYYGAKTTKKIKAEITFLNTYYNVYKFQLTHGKRDNLIYTEELIVHTKDNNSEFFQMNLGAGHKESVLYTDKNIEGTNLAEIYSEYEYSIQIFKFLSNPKDSYMRRAGYAENEKELYGDGSNLASYLYALKNTPEYKKYYDRIIKRIRMIMPQFADFSLEPTTISKDPHISLNWKSQSNHNYILGPHQLSDGTLMFIALTTLLLQPPEKLPPIIIIDEPELGLHPQALGILSGMIKTASQHCQVIVATQSPRLVDEFFPEDIIIAEWDKKGNCSRFNRLDKEKLSEWLENYSLSELWEKNVLGGQP